MKPKMTKTLTTIEQKMNASHLPPSHIHRFGGGKCNSCREPFHIPVSHETITTGTTNFRCENVAEVVAKSNDWA
jgi:hypothetical protein